MKRDTPSLSIIKCPLQHLAHHLSSHATMETVSLTMTLVMDMTIVLTTVMNLDVVSDGVGVMGRSSLHHWCSDGVVIMSEEGSLHHWVW